MQPKDTRWQPKHGKCAVAGLSPEQKREKLNAYYRDYHASGRRALTGEAKEAEAQKRKEYNAMYYRRNKERIIALQKDTRQAKRETEQQAAERKRKAVEANRKYRQKKAEAKPEKPKQRGKVKVYQTKAVDTAQLIPVRINAKTIVYARPGQNIEEIKQRYKRA